MKIVSQICNISNSYPTIDRSNGVIYITHYLIVEGFSYLEVLSVL